MLGRLVNAMIERPEVKETQATRAWKVGAAGERRVAEILDATGCRVLHDRRVPNSRANIDHVAIGPAGVFVIDAKKYEGKQMEVRDKGSLFSSDLRLYVGGRDHTKLVKAAKAQAEVVRTAVAGRDAAIHPVLCFVGAIWPGLFGNKPIRISGVYVTWPLDLGRYVSQNGPLNDDDLNELGDLLAVRLPPA